ncbi:tRNA threonylcarbamoyladenosine dehydratase, partial [Anoxybacillus geothermalis]|nr:tRNA threonylcarbamoyladenosine dehydratase [Anoxybacillus geothermalis]
MLHQFSRNELAIGPEGLEKLKNATVAVLGVGGVGSFAV